MRNLTKKLGAVEGSEDDLMKAFEFEKELAKVSRVVLVSSPPSFFYVFLGLLKVVTISVLFCMFVEEHGSHGSHGNRDGAVVRALASHQCGPGSIPGLSVIYMWVEFVDGSCSCSERFFSGYSGFPLSSKTNTSKFQFDLERVPKWISALC